MDIEAFSTWLSDDSVAIDVIDHQDGNWVIASAFSSEDLILLYAQSGAVPSRRDRVLFALVVQLQSVLESNDSIDADSLASLTEFIRGNWVDILRIDREMGLGGDFDTYVVPYIGNI